MTSAVMDVNPQIFNKSELWLNGRMWNFALETVSTVTMKETVVQLISVAHQLNASLYIAPL